MEEKFIRSIAFISDIHGNFLSLKKVIDKIKSFGCDQIYFLGDSIGYLPYPNETLDILKQNNIKCIKGNHELMAIGELSIDDKVRDIYNIDLTIEKISTENLDFIKSWPTKIIFKENNISLLGVHATPNSPYEGYIYPDTNLNEYDNLNYNIVCMGHTHYPMKRNSNNILFLNPGSVGLPRDHIGYSSFATINFTSGEARIHRVNNDLSLIQKHNDKGYFNSLLRKCNLSKT